MTRSVEKSQWGKGASSSYRSYRQVIHRLSMNWYKLPGGGRHSCSVNMPNQRKGLGLGIGSTNELTGRWLVLAFHRLPILLAGSSSIGAWMWLPRPQLMNCLDKIMVLSPIDSSVNGSPTSGSRTDTYSLWLCYLPSILQRIKAIRDID